MRRSKGEDGAAAVEFALLLPVLVSLVFGMIDTGVWLNQKITATEAARQGLRSFVLATGTFTDRRDRGRDVVNAALVKPINRESIVFTECTTPDPPAVSLATVTFDYTSAATIGLIPGFTSIKISGKAVMPCAG